MMKNGVAITPTAHMEIPKYEVNYLWHSCLFLISLRLNVPTLIAKKLA